MEHGSTGRAGHEPCLECEVPELARNHYFTGKLLTELDLTREQRYHLGKQRRHNQRLHGWGVACGLRVVAHETEACQSRYVRIEPGTAVDCCGREITVQRIESFDFLRAAEEAFERSGREGSLGDAAHRLQICVRYVECPTEELPVLFDGCADGVDCQPNTILDGYAFDVMLDAEVERDDPHGPRLVWGHTINVARAKRVALDEPGGRLYLLTDDDPGRLFVLDAATDALLTAYTLPAAADDIALAPDGAFLFAALPADGVVVVLDAAKLDSGAAAVRDLPVGDAGPGLRLAVSPADGRVFVLNPSAAEVTSWDASVTGPGRRPPAGRIAVGDGAAGMAVSPSGRWLLVPNAGAGTVTVVDAQSLAVAPAIELGPSAAPTAVALAETTAGIHVYVADGKDLSVRALGFAPADSEPYPPLGEPQTLAHPPLELHASTGGRWLYALERDGDEGVLQVVDAFALQTGRAGAAGTQARLGQIPSGALLAGRRLYVAFTGSETSPGGVALVDVLEERCDELLERAGEPCPSCDGEDCVVLATVEGYREGDRLTPASIDNRRGRRLLASTALLTEVVECILEHGVGEGERGPQGPPGPPGPAGGKGDTGPGFTSASVEHAQTPAVTPDFPAPGNLHFRLPVVTGADATPGAAAAASYGANGVIHFTIPPGAPGSQGPGFTSATVDHGANPTVTPNVPTPGNLDFKLPVVKSADAGPGPLVSATYDKPSGNIHFTFPWHKAVALTHICAISWKHGEKLRVTQEPTDLLIAFDGLVVSEDIHDHSVRVLQQSNDGCWCQIDGALEAWTFEELCKLGPGKPADPGPNANGIRFHLRAGSFGIGLYRVIVDGDFIRDASKNGVDADHLPPWVGFGLTKSGDGIEGGTFESWFEVTQ